MCSVTRFVGLDCHQESIQVCMLIAEGEVLANRKLDKCVGDVVSQTLILTESDQK